MFLLDYTFFVHDNIDLILYVLVRYKASYEMNSDKLTSSRRLKVDGRIEAIVVGFLLFHR